MVNREEFKRDLQDLVSDDPSFASGLDEEIIYQIDDLTIYSGHDSGKERLSHKDLLGDVTWKNFINWGVVVSPEARTYISDSELDRFEDMGFERLSTMKNHIMGFNHDDSEEPESSEIELNDYDLPYKLAVDFEMTKFEELSRYDDGEILYKRFENGKEVDSGMFESEELLFDLRFKDRFIDSLNSMDTKDLIEYFGQDNFDYIINNDPLLQKTYSKVELEEKRILDEKNDRERLKERDLDNDGSPDRIDVDDNRNAVQVVSDLDIVKSGTSKEQMQNKTASADELER